jgi:hypothetical protein
MNSTPAPSLVKGRGIEGDEFMSIIKITKNELTTAPLPNKPGSSTLEEME